MQYPTPPSTYDRVILVSEVELRFQPSCSRLTSPHPGPQPSLGFKLTPGTIAARRGKSEAIGRPSTNDITYCRSTIPGIHIMPFELGEAEESLRLT